MGHRLFCAVCAAAVLQCLCAAGLHADEGKDVFEKCCTCHKAGGEAEVFAPTKFAARQWQRFFERDKHSRKKDISADFTATELQAVETFLRDHAADSDKPLAIGLL